MPRTVKNRNSTMQVIDMDRRSRIDMKCEIGTVINVDDWLLRPETKLICSCDLVRDETIIPSRLMLSNEYLYILQPTRDEGKLVVKARRKLTTVMRITTKAKLCDVVKLQYGSKGANGDVHITDADKLVIPKKSGQVIKTIKSILQPKPVSSSPNSRRASIASKSPSTLSAPQQTNTCRRSSITSETKIDILLDVPDRTRVRRASVGSQPNMSLESANDDGNGNKFSTISALVEHHFFK